MKKREVLEIDDVVYTLESLLGQGGAAKVWRVRSSADGLIYALKRIAKAEGSSERHERFRNEITFGIAARHQNVVKIHAQNEDADYFNYTMDFYSKNLREIIDEETNYEVLLNYLTQLCDGLAYVHAKDVVHRDIKPENILVDSDNRRLVLADFGIAHFKDSSLTKRGDLLVNRNYLAPEQMTKNNARGIGKPADIFALGLIMTEAFTKQNSRGARHKRVSDIYPFLSDLDRLVDRMMLQDETQRIGIEAVRDSLYLISRQVESRIEEVVEELRRADAPTTGESPETDLILERAGKDVLSAKYIFERTADDELSRYNLNYHCEIGYCASTELYNACVQSTIYSMCKKKFEYEAHGSWSPTDLNLVVSPTKAKLIDEFESIQHLYALSQDSIWGGLPRVASYYFRFIKDYHCKELIQSIRQMVSDSGAGSLRSDLLDAPIIRLARNARRYLKTDLFEVTEWHLEQLEFERHVEVIWEGTCLEDSARTALGADLFDKPHDAESIAHILDVFENRWNVSTGARDDGSYSIHFRSSDEYERFSQAARAVATSFYVFEGDVLDLLRTAAEYDDLVALVWEPTYDIRITLAKILGLREIS
ncbi:serine/threonine-protein kinase [Cryobacterium sp. TMS1-20-1]|uniref:serine/threonine-protein kinase n=1 Tax=Cryobacterium sp. TMS1-20-1 TaxID=1259223 RepID=UPI00141AA7FD|nr:serine/threonine-protein kinase [Cryobacterium sp. TMS1-20-1]